MRGAPFPAHRRVRAHSVSQSMRAAVVAAGRRPNIYIAQSVGSRRSRPRRPDTTIRRRSPQARITPPRIGARRSDPVSARAAASADAEPVGAVVAVVAARCGPGCSRSRRRGRRGARIGAARRGIGGRCRHRQGAAGCRRWISRGARRCRWDRRGSGCRGRGRGGGRRRCDGRGRCCRIRRRGRRRARLER